MYRNSKLIYFIYWDWLMITFYCIIKKNVLFIVKIEHAQLNIQHRLLPMNYNNLITNISCIPSFSFYFSCFNVPESDELYEWAPLLHGSLEYLVLIGQSLHSTDSYFSVMTVKLYNWPLCRASDFLHSCVSFTFLVSLCDIIGLYHSHNRIFGHTLF